MSPSLVDPPLVWYHDATEAPNQTDQTGPYLEKVAYVDRRSAR